MAIARLLGLLPSLGNVAVRLGSTTIATRLAVTLLRTAGWFQNTYPDVPGPVFGLGGGQGGFPGRFLPRPGLAFLPGLGSFLSGFAYRNENQVKTGWLSLFGELLFSPVVEGNLEEGLKDLEGGDIEGFFNQVGQAVAEDLGIGALAAFFRGIASWNRDFRRGTGIAIPPNVAGEAVVLVDGVLRTFGSSVAGWVAGLFGFKLEEGLPFDPGRLQELGEEAKRKGGDTREVAMALRRIIRIVPIGEAARRAAPTLGRLARLIFAQAD